MIRDRRGSILKQFGEYDRILTFTENQSAKFDFLLDSYGDTGGFEALMRCGRSAISNSSSTITFSSSNATAKSFPMHLNG